MNARLRRRLRRLWTLPFLVTALMFSYAWYWIEGRMLASIPEAYILSSVTLMPVAGDVVIGRRELGQRGGAASAEARHIRLVYENGGWTIYNVAATRRVLINYADYGELYLRRWEARVGDRIRVGERIFHIEKIDPSEQITMTLEWEGHDVTYDIFHRNGHGASVEARVAPTGERPQAWLNDEDCGLEPDILTSLKEWFSRFEFLRKDAERPLASFGGGVDCADRIAVPDADPDSLRLMYSKGAVFFAPTRSLGQPVFFQRDRQWQGFPDIGRPLFPKPEDRIGGRELGAVKSIIIGRTYYRVSKNDSDALTLEPIQNVHRFFSTAKAADRESLDKKKHLDMAKANAPQGVSMELSKPLGPNGRYRLFPSFEDVGDWLRGRADPERTALLERFAGSALLGAVIIIATGMLAGFLRRQMWTIRLIDASPWFTAVILGGAVFCAAVFWSLGAYADDVSRRDLELLLISSWLLATFAVARTPERDWRLMTFWLVVSVVIAAGALDLELLAWGSDQTRWLEYDSNHMRSLAATFLLVVIVLSIDMESWRDLVMMVTHNKGFFRNAVIREIPLIMLILLILLFLVFLAWLIFGREEGLGSFQPMELGKLIAILVFAVIATSLDHSRRYAHFLERIGSFWLSLVVLILFYAFLFGVIPFAKSDFSPILILSSLGLLMLVIVAAWLLAHRLARNLIHRRRLRTVPGETRKVRRWRPGLELFTVIVGVALAFSAYWLIKIKMDYVKETHLTQEAFAYDTPQERVAVYFKPDEHPDLGAQLLSSLQLIGETPCYGWESNVPFPRDERCKTTEPEDAFGLNPASAMRIPAVQDDFIVAFFIHRFGVTGATILAVAQITVLWLMLDGAIRKYVWDIGDYADDAVRQVLCFLTLGGAGLLLLQWTISWGNAFGLLPVMGQPMTWISVGNSHILFLATPLLAATLIMMRLPNGRRSVVLGTRHGSPPTSAGMLDRVLGAIWHSKLFEITKTQRSWT